MTEVPARNLAAHLIGTSGDRFILCSQGHRHWGQFGAAGVLLVHGGRGLVAKRAAASHHGNTWSTPGGAIQRGEDPIAAAIRELHEETGMRLADRWELLEHHINDHGGWRYETFVIGVDRPLTWSAQLQWETTELRWFTVDEIDALAQARIAGLHPDFRGTWLHLRSNLQRGGQAGPPADGAGRQQGLDPHRHDGQPPTARS